MVIITIGYSATFVAGFLAIVYVLRDFVSNKVAFDKVNRTGITKMIYGIVCFATLFSFVGTVLGGIWADQSWGRFWGWDPKENGALMIVIWNAAILHALGRYHPRARYCGCFYLRQRDHCVVIFRY